ncbi:MAG: hypothetical protein NVS3B28_04720 [Candidatus Velthaea sp.]
MLRAATGAVRVFPERGTSRIVADVDRQTEAGANRLAERHVIPLEIRRIADRAGQRIDVAGRPDADRGGRLVFRVGECAVDDVFDRSENGIRRMVGDVLLVPVPDLPALIDDRRHDVRSAEIDADRLAHYFAPFGGSTIFFGSS